MYMEKKTCERRDLSPELRAYARAKAMEHGGDSEALCRRYRRWSAVVRCVVLAAVLAAVALAMESGATAYAGQPSTTGTLATGEAIGFVQQMLSNR